MSEHSLTVLELFWINSVIIVRVFGGVRGPKVNIIMVT
jgi:hypothetical protein